MRATIAKWGNSAALRLPKAVMEELRLKPGQQVDVVVQGSEARITPVRKSAPERLKELMAECDRIGWESAPPTVEWGPDVGTEIIDDDYSRKPGRNAS